MGGISNQSAINITEYGLIGLLILLPFNQSSPIFIYKCWRRLEQRSRQHHFKNNMADITFLFYILQRFICTTKLFATRESISTTAESRTYDFFLYDICQNLIVVQFNITLTLRIYTIILLQININYLIGCVFNLTFIVIIRILDKNKSLNILFTNHFVNSL